MGSLKMPKDMSPPSLEERLRFYSHSFNPKESGDFTNAYESPVYAIDLGNESGIHNPDFSRYINKLVYITNPKDLRQKLIHYTPEDVYYSRNMIKDNSVCKSCTRRSRSCPSCRNFIGQELAFDIDPENIECELCKIDKGQSIYSFCTHQLIHAKTKAIELYRYLKKEKDYNNLKIVYSGRGYHIHVLDEKAYLMPIKERIKLASVLKAAGYPIDPWVTEGRIDLIRLPGSIHGLVNRIVKEIPIKEIESFDPLYSKKVIPKQKKITH